MQSNNLKYTPWTAKNEGSKQDMSGRFHAILTGSTLLLQHLHYNDSLAGSALAGSPLPGSALAGSALAGITLAGYALAGSTLAGSAQAGLI